MNTSTALADLLRWEAAGGTWRPNEAGTAAVLLTCNGGDEMGVITSDAPDFRAYVHAATR